ncbi:MAG TPA: hypothetical protein VGC77_12875 [Rhodopseudomonas sp.]
MMDSSASPYSVVIPGRAQRKLRANPESRNARWRLAVQQIRVRSG